MTPKLADGVRKIAMVAPLDWLRRIDPGVGISPTCRTCQRAFGALSRWPLMTLRRAKPGSRRGRARPLAMSLRHSALRRIFCLNRLASGLLRHHCLIRSEKLSGTTTEGRSELQTVLDFLRKGDTLLVTRVDRLARSIGDLQDIVRAVKAKGAALRATEQPIDTSTAAGKAFLDMLGVFAEFETNLRRERELEGIAEAKAAGVYKGRPASIDPAIVAATLSQGLGASAIAKRLGIGRASVHRALGG
jgi:DNA invertase Pin-like site-specific DNA recombinase